jgi:protoporphyrinogen oxidase
MGIDWIGQRVFFPKVEDVEQGALAPLQEQTHYIKTVRYPERGGYMAFAKLLEQGANLRLNTTVSRVSLREKRVWASSGETFHYTRLINTLPLPVFLDLCDESTPAIREAARELSCTSVDLVEVTASHPTRRPENWIYVYDETLLSTRINCTELLSPNNAPAGHTGVQVEVYSSRHRPRTHEPETIGKRVTDELRTMSLLDPNVAVKTNVRHIPWANVIFHKRTRPALEQIWTELEAHGLVREQGDTDPLPRQDSMVAEPGTICFAGRFGQWKYAWTDDCVLRGKQLAESATL